MEENGANMAFDSKINANNSEIIAYGDDDSDFEIEITNGFFLNTVNIDIVPKQNAIQFREKAQSTAKLTHNEANVVHTYSTMKTNQLEDKHAYESKDSANPTDELETGIQTVKDINADPKRSVQVVNAKEKSDSQYKTRVLSSVVEESEQRHCRQSIQPDYTENNDSNDLNDIQINIVHGECPGTIDINIVFVDTYFTGQSEMTINDSTVPTVPVMLKPDHDNHVFTEEHQSATVCTDEVSYSSIQHQRSPMTDEVKRSARKEKEIIILSRKSSSKSRTSQSSPCLVNSHEACDVTPDLNDTSGDFTESRFHPKRNQDNPEQTGKLKRFKGTSDLILAKRQSKAERGDFAHNSDSQQKKSILDDIDEVIPRVIPRSGRQVKFGDEISGNRLVQLSPEKRFSSEEASPSKAEKSILKKTGPSDESCIEPQVYYNSSYTEDDSDGNDSGLAEEEDYRIWDCRDYRFQSHERPHQRSQSPERHSTNPNSEYYQRQRYDQVHNHASAGARVQHRSPRHAQTQWGRTSNFSGRRRAVDQNTPLECNVGNEYNPDCFETRDEYHSTGNHYSTRSAGFYPWTVHHEAYGKENHIHDASFGSDTVSEVKRGANSKKQAKQYKQARKDKKVAKKRNKTETDIERCGKFLSTGQVRLASRGNFDVRRVKLEYLLHIGDFSMKYKTEPGPIEPMTLTMYVEAVGPSIDVRHMLNMQSSFVNRLRYCLRRGREIWLMHKFLHLGALQVLMNRDPYRAVLGEVHAQFITAGLLIGINYLHQNGITHGNLYPWKVLINDRGYPVLTGFLPLHDSNDAVTSELRERRRYTFSVPYAAPDRFIGDMHPSVDLFSIGCIAYEIVVGRTPFHGGSEERTKENILSYSYRPAYDYETLSFAGEMFIDCCLRKHSAHRFVPGRHLSNLYKEEWFSTLDLGRYEDQSLDSPILDVVELLHRGETLDLEERNLDYNWGRIMDIMSPHSPTLVY